jgi:hypothetical protein
MSKTKLIASNNINSQKRSFLKTLSLSMVFIAFGGIGSIVKTLLFDQTKETPKAGFGSNGYGK